jgi:uncharacterized protein (TIGR02266 family)
MRSHQSSGAIQRLDIELRDRRDFESRYLSESPHGGLLVAAAQGLSEGDLVELSIRLERPAESHRIRGAVLFLRQSEGRQLAGIGFLPTETAIRERLLRSRSGGQGDPGEDAARREHRYETTLRIRYQTSSDFAIDYTRNLSTGGVFINSKRPPRVGSSILFQLFAPGEAEPIDLPGKVAWRRAGQGFGVRFTASDSGARRRLDNLVRHVAIDASTQVRAPVVEEVTS